MYIQVNIEVKYIISTKSISLAGQKSAGAGSNLGKNRPILADRTGLQTVKASLLPVEGRKSQPTACSHHEKTALILTLLEKFLNF